jgi:uncharacterized protein (TIGR02145 family)
MAPLMSFALVRHTLFVKVALCGLFAIANAACLAQLPSKHAMRMLDGKEWTTENLNVNIEPSYCYEGVELNCRRYGRLYTWASAQRGCQSLGGDWRLPTSDDWTQMAKHYGGILDASGNSGKAAYAVLITGGSSGFNVLLGGNRSVEGNYSRAEAHGLYWTATETDPDNAIFYNFGRGGEALNRQNQGEKQMAISVRCVKQ